MENDSHSQLIKTREFLKEVEDKTLLEILRSADSEIQRYERLLHEYCNNLGGLIFFLNQYIKPGSVQDSVFLEFRPIVENLVRQGALKNELLEQFNLDK